MFLPFFLFFITSFHLFPAFWGILIGSRQKRDQPVPQLKGKVVQNLCKGLQNSNYERYITSPHSQVLLFCFQFPLSLFFVLDARHPNDSTKITTNCCEKLTGRTLIKDTKTKVTLRHSLLTFPSFCNLFLSSADFRLYSAAILNATAPIACLISKPNWRKNEYQEH